MKTTNLKKKALSILLSIVMLLGMMPASAFAAENTEPAVITGLSIIIDGVEYSSGDTSAGSPAVITPNTQSIFLIAHGTNLQNATADNCVSYRTSYAEMLDDSRWSISADGTVATFDFSGYKTFLESIATAFEMKYSNDGGDNYTGSGVYIIYDTTVVEDDAAVITGLTITIDDVEYDGSNTSAENPAVITPDTQSIVVTAHGINLQNSTENNKIEYYPSVHSAFLGAWDVNAEGTVATYDLSHLKLWDGSITTAFEIGYCNDGSDNYIGSGVYVTYDGTGEEVTTLVIGDNEIKEGVAYAYTAEQDGTLYITITKFYYGDDFFGTVEKDGLNSWVTVFINGTVITDFANTAEVAAGDTVIIFMQRLDSDVYYGTVNLGWDAPVFAEITGLTITIDGEEYDSSNTSAEDPAIITPDTQSIIITAHCTDLQNITLFNRVYYSPSDPENLTSSLWSVNEDGTAVTGDFSNDIHWSTITTAFEMMYSNDGGETEIESGLYIKFVKPVPDSDGKIVVDMADGYGDGWNGAAIDIYKNGILEATATVEEVFGTLSVDYDSTANYKFKWVEGEYDDECSFTIYVDGEVELNIEEGAEEFETGETILTLGTDSGGEDDKAVITGLSILIDDVEYNSGNTSAESPAVITPNTQSIFLIAYGTNLHNGTEDNIIYYIRDYYIPITPGYSWSFIEEGTAMFYEYRMLEFNSVTTAFEMTYSNDGGETEIESGLYIKFVKPVPDSDGKIVVDMADGYGDGWNGAAIEIYKNGILEATATVEKDFGTLSVDYDSTANYEFKWVEGEYNIECSFTIYVDGEVELNIEQGTVEFENGETILTLGTGSGDEGDEGGEEENAVASVTIGEAVTYHENLDEAIQAVKDCTEADNATVKLLKDLDVDQSITSGVFALDLNGFDLTGTVEVAEGKTLLVKDTQTDDYTVEDEYGYGKLISITGTVSAAPGYMMITEDDGTSFHRLNLDAAFVTLRAANAGIYYRNQFGGDEVIKRNIVAYGTALGAGEMPGFQEKTFTRFDDMTTWNVGMDENGNSNNLKNGTILTDIMHVDNGYSRNKRNSEIKIYSQAYVELPDGTRILGEAVSFSLREILEGTDGLVGVDAVWETLEDEQKAPILDMFASFKSVLKNWNIPNIRAAAQ